MRFLRLQAAEMPSRYINANPHEKLFEELPALMKGPWVLIIDEIDVLFDF